MPVPKNLSRDQVATRGFQEYLIIDSTPVGAEALIGTFLKDAGVLSVVGTYDCLVDTAGLANVAVTLTPSAIANTVTPSFFSTYANKTTARTTAAGAVGLAAATPQTLTVALVGETRCICRIVLGASATANFATRAEANGL